MQLPVQVWPSVVNIFEEILNPSVRTSLYNQFAPFMPSKKESGRGWYSPKREKGVVAQLFPSRYKLDEFYARIFPDRLSEDNTNSSKKGKGTLTITGVEREYKVLYDAIFQVKSAFVSIVS